MNIIWYIKPKRPNNENILVYLYVNFIIKLIIYTYFFG